MHSEHNLLIFWAHRRGYERVCVCDSQAVYLFLFPFSLVIESLMMNQTLLLNCLLLPLNFLVKSSASCSSYSFIRWSPPAVQIAWSGMTRVRIMLAINNNNILAWIVHNFLRIDRAKSDQVHHDLSHLWVTHIAFYCTALRQEDCKLMSTMLLMMTHSRCVLIAPDYGLL